MNINKWNLEKDYYTVKMIGKNIAFQRIFLIKNESHWRWDGVLHETLASSAAVQGELLEGVINAYNWTAGARSSDPDKWEKDIAILKKVLEKEPEHPRYCFYLAQTYAVNGQLEEALQYYQKRVEIGEKKQKTCPEEMFWSLYCIACLQSDLKQPHDVVIESFLKAFYANQTRAEPLYRLAAEFQLMESYFMGYLILEWALQLPLPEKALRMQHAVYDYLMLIKRAECACYIGKTKEALSIYQKLLIHPKVPSETKELIEKNIHILEKHEAI